MAKPKIRHLAIVTRDPMKMGEFYSKVFDMEIISTEGGACMLSDGYLTVALLKHRLTGEKTCGLNHFGFLVEERDLISERIVDFGLEDPKARPAERPYAEYRGCDPDGNMFDISEHGYERSDAGVDHSKPRQLAKVK